MKASPLNAPLDELLLDAPAQRAVLALLGLAVPGAPRDGFAERCRRRALEPRTTLRVLRALGRVDVGAPESMELVPLPELCVRTEQGDHAALRREIAVVRRRLRACRREMTGPGCGAAGVLLRAERLCRELVGHLSREQRLLLRPGPAEPAPGARPALRIAIERARREHIRVDERLDEVRREIERRSGLRAWARLSQELARLQEMLHVQFYREHHALFPRLLAVGRA